MWFGYLFHYMNVSVIWFVELKCICILKTFCYHKMNPVLETSNTSSCFPLALLSRHVFVLFSVCIKIPPPPPPRLHMWIKSGACVPEDTFIFHRQRISLIWLFFTSKGQLIPAIPHVAWPWSHQESLQCGPQLTNGGTAAPRGEGGGAGPGPRWRVCHPHALWPVH